MQTDTQAQAFNLWLSLPSQDLSEEVVTRILSDVKIPEYRPSEKVSISIELSLISTSALKEMPIVVFISYSL